MKISTLAGLILFLGLLQGYDQKQILGNERCPIARKLKNSKGRRRLNLTGSDQFSSQYQVEMRHPVKRKWKGNQQRQPLLAQSNPQQNQGQTSPAGARPQIEPVYRQNTCPKLDVVGTPLNFLPAIEPLIRSITKGTKTGKTRPVFLGIQPGKSIKIYAIFQTLIKTGSSFLGVKVSVIYPKSVTLVKMVYALEPISVMVDLGMKPIKLEPLTCPPIEEQPLPVVVRERVEPVKINEKGEVIGRYSGEALSGPVTVTRSQTNSRRLDRFWSFK